MIMNSIQDVKKFMDNRSSQGIKPGLERVLSMLSNVGYVNKSKVIHVTGTNGKGSFTAFLEAGLKPSNLNIGTFTSPSLDGLCGYFHINGEVMREQEFIFYLNRLLPIINDLDELNNHPSEFEIITLIGLLYFEDKADVAIIEAGMGGLEDTTNVVKPILSVITSISIDHQAFLGDTIEEITRHKAGIIKEDTPVIVGRITDDSMKIITEKCISNHSELYSLGHDFNVKYLNGLYYYTNNLMDEYTFNLKVKGIHQADNAALALEALVLLKDLDININAAIKSVKQLEIVGRFEIIKDEPSMIIDGAHNEASMKAFISTIELEPTSKVKHLIISSFKDKPLKLMLDLAESHFDIITVTTFNHPRAYSFEELNRLDLGVEVEDNWMQLIKDILKYDSKTTTYYIVGSVYFTTLVKSMMNE